MMTPSLTHSRTLLLSAVVVLSLSGCCNAQDSVSVITLNKAPSSPLPVLIAPNNLTASMHFMRTYSLNQSTALSGAISSNFTVAANSTVLISGFSLISCVSMEISASTGAVYGFVTNYTPLNYLNASGGQQEIRLYSPSGSSSAYVVASAISSSTTLSRQLSLGRNASSGSGAVATSASLLQDYLTPVVVNPTSKSVSVTLELGLSPLGPCNVVNTCSTQRDSDSLLGNCGTDLTNATYLNNGVMRSAAAVEPSLQPRYNVLRDIDQGASSVVAAFTNAACMLYTIRLSKVPANLDQTKPQLTAWVATSAQQQQIVSSGNATAAQRLSLNCSYPAWTDNNRPCFYFTTSLSPNETYFVWVQNTNGSAGVGGSNVLFELMVLRDTADCSQPRLFNLSSSYQALNKAATPLNYTLAANITQAANITLPTNYTRSPYDPGVMPFSFVPGYSVIGFHNILAVGPDNSLSQVGAWNSTWRAANGTYAVQIVPSPTYSFSLNRSQATPLGFTFTNAACFSETLNSNNAITSYLLPRSTLISGFNFSNSASPYMSVSPNAFESRVPGSDHSQQTSVDTTIKNLTTTETYSFLVAQPAADNTLITYRTTAYPAGSSACQQAGQSSAASGAARGVYDSIVNNVNSSGGASPVVALTNAACIAFAISARGLYTSGSGPQLYSQYYNISSPGSSTFPFLSASAIMLKGNTINERFLLKGFIDPSSPQQSPTPLPIITGCLVNYTNPGPCVVYADNLNASEYYYIWGVNGAKSSASWFLISYEARPSGSCKDALLSTTNGGNSAPATIMPRPSSKVSVGVIVGPVVGAVVAVAAATLLVVCLMKRRRTKQLPPPSTGSYVTSAFKPVEKTESYVNYSDLLGSSVGTGSISIPNKTGGSETRNTSFGQHTQSSIGSANISSSAQGMGPAEIVANVAAAAEAGQQTPTSVQSGVRQSPAMILEQGDRWEFKLSELKLKTGADGKAIKLGEGGFGSVYLGFLGVRDVAVKIATGASVVQRDNFLREIQTLKGCRDLNIVNFLGASVGEQIVLLMEFMAGGDLYKAIRADVKHHFRWNNCGSKLALDIIKGLYHLHSNNIIHLDLKSPNILLSDDWRQAKISDVGLAKFSTDAGTRPEQGLSVAWASPEQIWGSKCTTASDMFSLGVVLWEICTGESPNERRIFRPIQAPAECPQAVVDLVAQCMLPDATKRPTAQEAHQVLSKCVRTQSRDMSSV